MEEVDTGERSVLIRHFAINGQYEDHGFAQPLLDAAIGEADAREASFISLAEKPVWEMAGALLSGNEFLFIPGVDETDPGSYRREVRLEPA